jgi:RNA polymerase sigma-70 factor (ECF subfamily)
MQIDHVASETDECGEAELIGGLLLGSDRSWREFHSRYDRLIYRCITKVTSRFAFVSHDDIREIYATLLLQLLSNDMHKLRTYDAARGSRFSSWIGLLAVNAAYDHLRTQRREPNRAPVSEAEALGSEEPSPLEVVERRERSAQLEALLQTFSAKDREFVSLYFGEGLDAEVVAERMRISVKTVYSKKHKIRTRLEAMLAEAA